MKLPSIRTKLPCTRNRTAIGFAGILLTALFLMGASFPASASSIGAPFTGVPLAPVTPVVEEDDLITLLGLSLGGRDVAMVAWANMNPSEKQTLRDQAVRIATMAQGAERDGLSSSPDVARALWWGTSYFLADAWEKKISSETDLSEDAARSFYEANRQRYMGSGAVRYRKAVYPASQKDVASRVKVALHKAPLSRLKNCVTVNWTEYESIALPLGDVLRTSPVGVVMGPIETQEGHILYEVIERRKEEPLAFEQCRARVREDLIRVAVMERIERLKSE